MALTEYTIKITNTKSNPTVLGNPVLDLVIISPTLVTTPQTPYDNYISDMLTVTPGTISIPLYKREQFFNLPAASVLTITTDDGQEALYYENMELEGAVVTVTTAPVEVVLAAGVKSTSIESSNTSTGITVAITGAAASTMSASDFAVSPTTDKIALTYSSGTLTIKCVSGVTAGAYVVTGTKAYDGTDFSVSFGLTVTE